MKDEYYQELKQRIQQLEEENAALRAENVKLQSELHKPSKAGRKSFDPKMAQQYGRFRELINTGKSREEIMAAMQISIATYYRYQKMYQELEGADQSITGTQTMGQFRIMQWIQKNYAADEVKVKFSGRNAATLYDKQGGQLQVQYDPGKKEIIIKKSERF